MTFESLGLSSALLDALAGQNYTQPYPIQESVIPAILNRKDVLGIAQTGSGKTAGYVLPILMNLQGQTVSTNRNIRALVLVPTRELAMQVNEVFNRFGMNLPRHLKMMVVYGGVSINPQMMRMNGVEILVATPGRLLELIDLNAVHLSEVSTLVLDEADKMLNLGFREEMDRILVLLPKKRQNLLFSATLSEDVAQIHQLLLRDPFVVKIEPEKDYVELIDQLGYFISEEKKGPLLRYLLKSQKLQQVLVFTSSVYKADAVADKLRKNGINATSIHSQKSQGARTEALEKFKSGKIRVLVATDLISRGIDIPFLPHVINYELPRSPKDYLHRIGRTGRAENPGEAISLVSPEEQHHFRIIQKKMGKPVTMIDGEAINLQGY
jgi:ATP-dependent RNA helicase RhlE